MGGAVYVWRDLGGSLVRSEIQLPQGLWNDLALGDVSGDGRLDVALRCVAVRRAVCLP